MIDKRLNAAIKANVTAALAEDLNAKQDITALLIPEHERSEAKIITRENMILCGAAWVDEVFAQIDTSVKLNWKAKDGDQLAANSEICTLSGSSRSLLTGERTALNLLQMLSAVATVTNRYVSEVAGTKTKLLDTRKTIPGMRLAEKYAVVCGGGYNHRMGLYDQFLIKENHIHACGSIKLAVANARQLDATKKLEVEVENLQQLEEALNAGADIIMLDNFSLEQMVEAVKRTNHRAKLEVSGNVTLDSVAAIAQTGVDFISVGALTKNIRAIDLSMLFI